MEQWPEASHRIDLSAPHVPLFCALTFCFVMSACGGGSSSGCGAGNHLPCPTSPEFLYAVAPSAVLEFSLDPKSGMLGAAVSAPGPPSSGGMAIAKTSVPYLYAADLNHDIWGYSINTSSGALTELAGSPFPLADVGVPPILATDPSGKFLYASTTNGVYGFTVDAGNGMLTSIPGSPFSVGGSAQGTADGAEPLVTPSGKFLYVATYSDPNSQIAAFSIDSTTGILTTVPGSPFLAATGAAGWGVTMDTSGKFLYLTLDFNEIMGFSVDSMTGSLIPLTGFPVQTGVSPATPIVSDTNVLYVPASGIWAYTIESTSGSLTAVKGAPFPGNVLPEPGANITIDATESYLYGGFFGLSVSSSSGVLTPLTLPTIVAGPAVATYP